MTPEKPCEHEKTEKSLKKKGHFISGAHDCYEICPKCYKKGYDNALKSKNLIQVEDVEKMLLDDKLADEIMLAYALEGLQLKYGDRIFEVSEKCVKYLLKVQRQRIKALANKGDEKNEQTRTVNETIKSERPAKMA